MAGVIRFKPIDGEWATLGAERYRGVVAENIEATANSWGPDQLTFSVKVVDPASLRPDLLPYTPIELEVGGMLVWSGRIKARPSGQQDHQIQCEGWQYHLDDDDLDRVWVHTRLSEYRDQRTFLTGDLTLFRAFGTVANDNGVLTLMIPKGTTLVVGDRVGVVLDLGPDSVGKRLVITWDSSNNTSTVKFVARGANQESLTGTGEDFFNFVCNTGATGTSAGTAATTRRYIGFVLESTGAGTTLADIYVRVKTAMVFRDTAYESGNASILKAEQVVIDLLPFVPLLNQTTAYISAGTFSIPECLTQAYQSPREVADFINAYENYRIKIGGADLRSLVYDVKPTAPLYKVGEESGSQFADASMSGDEIYSRAIVDGTGPDGLRLVALRLQTGTLVDRNGFVRSKVLPIRSAMTTAVANRFGDLWLTEHMTAPFSGKLSATNGIERMLGGASVPAHEMLLAAGEKIHLAHRIDPDTGAQGRDGRIAGVTYRDASRSVELDIDDRRDHFDEILTRYGAVVDQF